MLSCVRSKYIYDAGGIMFMDFDLAGSCLLSRTFSVVWYCSPIADQSAFGLVISLDFTLQDCR